MQAADYEQVQQVLTQAHSLTDAAEAHGTLAGCLCSTVAYRFEDWMLEILPDGAARFRGHPGAAGAFSQHQRGPR